MVAAPVSRPAAAGRSGYLAHGTEGLEIRPVAATPHLATVADWLHAAWWAADGFAPEAVRAHLAAATGPSPPVALVATTAGVPLGTASLELADLPSRPDLSPWLASVWVAPPARRRGIAAALLRAVEARAAALGHARLHLFTEDRAAFYAARGWRRAGCERWRGREVTLMTRRLEGSEGG